MEFDSPVLSHLILIGRFIMDVETVKRGMFNCRIGSRLYWVRNLVPDMKGRTQTEGI
jgi:hypothetical protein